MRQIGRPSAIGFIAALLLFGARSTKAQATASPSSARGAILVKVADGSDRPLWGGDIDLPILDVHFPVPDGGALLIKDVPAGTYVIQARRIGYALKRRIVRVGTDTTHLQFTLYPGAAIDTVKVTAFRDTWAEDFQRHQKMGFGSFYNSVDILESKAPLVSTFLRRVPGLAISVGEPDVVHTVRATGRCGMIQIYWDGMLMNATESTPATAIAKTQAATGYGNASSFDINTIPLEMIGGIEVYTNSANTPPVYGSTRNECGAVFLWTK